MGILEKYDELEEKFNKLVISSGKLSDFVPEEFIDIVKQDINKSMKKTK